MPRREPAPAGATRHRSGRLRLWQRIAVGLAAGQLALLLAGCDITGAVDVRSGTEVVADLTFTNAAVDCLGLDAFAGLTIKGIPDSGGDQLCRAQGTVDLEELKKFGIQVSQLGDYITVDLAMPQSLGYTPMQVDLRFPGPVREAGETTVNGNQVRLSTGTGMATTSPTRIVAMSHSGPEWWVIAGAAGFVAGIGLTLAAVFAFRRARRRGASDPSADSSDVKEMPTSAEAAQGSGASPDGGEAQPGHDAAEPVRDIGYEALFAPPATGAAAKPDPDPPATPSPPPDVPEPDHSMWAPPQDQPDR